MTDPENCKTMTDVRQAVDGVDADIIALLGRRFALMQAAARIKATRAAVRDEDRKAEVIANAIAAARTAGVPEALVATMWDMLVENSIAYEMALFDAKTRST
jgi:isochorismate pyruvate lyase